MWANECEVIRFVPLALADVQGLLEVVALVLAFRWRVLHRRPRSFPSSSFSVAEHALVSGHAYID